MLKVVSNWLTKTNKQHICDGCGRTFPKSTVMERCNILNTETKKFDISYCCETCQILTRHYCPNGGEYEIGQFAKEASHYENTGELL